MQTRFAGLHLFAGKLSLFALHFVGVGLCSYRMHPKRLPFQGRLWNAHSHGFPYEGKLSADRLTDEVDSAS